jgi:HEPN domain-containing protein
MKAATRDWIEKAEADYLAALDLARRRKRPLPDTVCFHCHQSAEKYLKARLEEGAVKFPRTHDLELLLALLLPSEPLWSALTLAAKRLTPFGVLIRSPGNDATQAQAREAVADCKAIRREVRGSLGPLGVNCGCRAAAA